MRMIIVIKTLNILFMNELANFAGKSDTDHTAAITTIALQEL